MNKSRVLALDIGLRRIGIAFAEEDTIISLDTIETANRDDAVAQILKICREEQIERIVLGVSHGASQENEDMIRSFALEINKIIDLPIKYVDETLTSKEAERILKDLKVDPKSSKYKKEIDRISAKLILEQYLNQL